MSKPASSLSSLSLLMRLTALVLFFGYIALQIFIMSHLAPKGGAFLLLLILPGLLPLLLPHIFYCAALWTAGSVFARMGRGETLTPVITSGLKTIGWQLTCGAIAAILISSSSAAWLASRETGAFWAHYTFPVEALTIGLIGLALIALSTQARRLHAELEQFV